jgi:TorA maturation chaperone TorD
MSDYAPDEATAREDLCRFLSACYYEPAPEFAQEHLFENMLIAAERLHPDLAKHARALGDAFAAQDLETLLVDYTRLFLGPLEALAKPYGSSWLSAPTPPEENPPPAVLELYSEGGFDIDPEFMELPDHVAVELEFLYLLNFNLQRADSAIEQQAVQALKQRFLREHLGAWIAPFSAAVTDAAQTAFYRELAELTTHFVQIETTAQTLH